MIGWIASTLSIIGIVLNAKKNIWCWPIWLLSNVLWVYHCMQVGDSAALVTWIVFGAFNIYGWYNWRKI